MSFKSKAALAAVVCSVLFSVGCGDTFRPIATPIITTGGQPQTQREVVVLSTAGIGAEGNAVHVDVSGDTEIAQVGLGRDPVHLALVFSGTATIVVNRSEASLTEYFTSLASLAQPPNFITLPLGSAPVFAYSNIGGVVFVAESGVNKVGVVRANGVTNGLTTEIQVGSNPVGLVGSPDGTHLYAANKTDGTVSVIDTGSNAVLATIPVSGGAGSAPTYLAINTAGTNVFSVNSGTGNVSIIDTTTNTETAQIPVGTTPDFAYFDAANNRLWVTNAGSNSVSVINTDVNSTGYKTVIATIALPGCSFGPLAAIVNPEPITVLADGSRAYVANSGCGIVSVISALSNTITKAIPVGSTPVAIVSSPDSSKVYTANNGSSNISIIQTSNDTVINTLAVPAGTSPIGAAIGPF